MSKFFVSRTSKIFSEKSILNVTLEQINQNNIFVKNISGLTPKRMGK